MNREAVGEQQRLACGEVRLDVLLEHVWLLGVGDRHHDDVCALLLPAIQAAREAARRASASVQLRQVALAAHVYNDSFQNLPATADASKGAPVSWRVKFLPYLEQSYLYDQYDQSQPWDSAKNRAISDRKVQIYHDINDPDINSTKTYFLAVVGPGTALEADKPVGLGQLHDPSRTILFVEANADRAVPWAEPKDLEYNSAEPRAGLGDVRPGGFVAAFADGSTRFIHNSADPDVLKAMMSRDDGDNGRVDAEINSP